MAGLLFEQSVQKVLKPLMPNNPLVTTLEAQLRRQAKLLRVYQDYITKQSEMQRASSEAMQQQLARVDSLLADYTRELTRLRSQLAIIGHQPERLALNENAEMSAGSLLASDELLADARLLITKIEQLERDIATLEAANAEIAIIESERKAKDQELLQLHEQLAAWNNSFSARLFVKPIWKLRRKVLPDGSPRAVFYFRARRKLGRVIRQTLHPGAGAEKPEVHLVASGEETADDAATETLVTPMLPPKAAPKYENVPPPPLSIPPGATVICTIVSKNYLASARVLMESIRRLHPELVLVTVLADEIDGYFDPREEPFQTLLASELNIPRWRHFSMKYDIMELNTAVKPYALQHFLEKYGAEKVIYFDPDIMVYQRLDALLALLDDHLCVLTPHITGPLNDTFSPSELDFLRVGTYNLGFFAIARRGDWQALLQWWEDRLYENCTREVSRGLFVDQHWMDLLPSLFASVYILRDPGYNVAYWNISTRDLQVDEDGTYTVNGSPLIFFHFSGFSVNNPEAVSKHQNRFTYKTISEAYRRCYEQYREALVAAGQAETQRLPYAYGWFVDGVPIPDPLRVALRTYDSSGEIWPDPYAIDTASSFRNWAIYPGAVPQYRLLSPHALATYSIRPDLQQAFPEVLTGQERRFAEWFITQETPADVFQPIYVEPIRRALRGEKQKVVSTPPLIPAKKNSVRGRAKQAIAYYRDFPTRVAPYLPPEVYSQPSNAYAGSHRMYDGIRRAVSVLGVRQRLRKIVGLRVIFTARHFLDGNPTAISSTRIPGTLPPFDLPEAFGAGDPTTLTSRTYGATVIGYLQAETGVGQIARNLISSLKTAHFPVAGYLLDVHGLYRQQDRSISEFVRRPTHFVNIFNVNADQAVPTYQSLGRSFYEDHYNIGYWFWELSRFPRMWSQSFEPYHEIWTATRFVQEAVQAQTTRPVHCVPVSIEVPFNWQLTRAALGLPADAYLVLYTFDALSVMERKNPWAVLRAFERAFTSAERTRKVRLVLKVSNLDKVPDANRLRSEVARLNGILIDRYMQRLEVNTLTHLCDAYISLHRSEGYGLTMAEAMYLGKPVIATAYSGNMDFMNDDNSYLIPYKLATLDRAYPPYEAGSVWADPDVEHAAHVLRQVYSRPEDASARGQVASQYIRRHYNAEVVGRAIAALLRERLDTYTFGARLQTKARL